MSYWTKWNEKKDKGKDGAEEYEGRPLPTRTTFADKDLEESIRTVQSRVSVSRSGCYRVKSMKRLQLSDESYKMAAAGPTKDCSQYQSQDGHSHGAGETADKILTVRVSAATI